MRIIVDAMGGDNAPESAVLGALQAQKEFGIDLILTGRRNEILALLTKSGVAEGEHLRIEHTDDVISNEDHGPDIMKSHRNCSMARGLDLLAAGEGDAFVSAGSTGALLTGATLICKRIRGVRRASLAPILPTAKGGAVLTDCGANAECSAEYLFQFGLLGTYYAEEVLKKENPKSMLLNIGAENTKGTPVHVEANAALRKASEEGLLNFAGNIEARDVMETDADVIIADGFSGNVLLKATEGTALFFAHTIKGIFSKGILSKLAALFVLPDIKALKKKLDYKEVGGAPLLGITKPVIKAHGSSDAYAIRSAIRQAKEYAASETISRITEAVTRMKEEK